MTAASNFQQQAARANAIAAQHRAANATLLELCHAQQDQLNKMAEVIKASGAEGEVIAAGLEDIAVQLRTVTAICAPLIPAAGGVAADAVAAIIADAAARDAKKDDANG